MVRCNLRVLATIMVFLCPLSSLSMGH
jgi:hypothetical protein